MPPEPRTIECVLNVAAPPGPYDGLYWIAGISAPILIIALGIVIFAWIDKRDRERDRELVNLRNENRQLRADARATGTI